MANFHAGIDEMKMEILKIDEVLSVSWGKKIVTKSREELPSIPGIHVVVKGVVSTWMDLPEGRGEAIRDWHGNGDFFGEETVFTDLRHRAFAETEVETIFFSRDLLLSELLKDGGKIALALGASVIERKNRTTDHVMMTRGYGHKLYRLVCLLKRLSEIGEEIQKEGERAFLVPFVVSQEKLANMLGCRRETIVSAVQKLIKQGIISKFEKTRQMIVHAKIDAYKQALLEKDLWKR